MTGSEAFEASSTREASEPRKPIVVEYSAKPRMNQVSSWTTAPIVVGGSVRRPLIWTAISPAMTSTASWARARIPIPSTLPISRFRGRTVERTTSTTRLCFSSTTPVSTQVPYEKMPMNIRMIPALAKMIAVVSDAVGGSSADTTGGASSSWPPAARSEITAAFAIAWSSLDADWWTISTPGPRQVRRHDQRRRDLVVADRGLGRVAVGQARDDDVDVVGVGRRLDGLGEARRRRLDDARSCSPGRRGAATGRMNPAPSSRSVNTSDSR